MSRGIHGLSGLIPPPSPSVSSLQQRPQGVTDLKSALQSGNLEAAQKAYSSLAGNSLVSANSPLGQIGAALQSGNVTVAQQKAQTLQSSRSTPPRQPAATTSAPASAPKSSSTLGGTIDIMV